MNNKILHNAFFLVRSLDPSERVREIFEFKSVQIFPGSLYALFVSLVVSVVPVSDFPISYQLPALFNNKPGVIL